jgi:hypothetical protein
MGNPNVTLNIGLLTTKEVVYKGSFRYGVRLATSHDLSVLMERSPAII